MIEMLQVANTFGVLGLLVFFTWAFYDGRIISKKILDEIMKDYQSQTEQAIRHAVETIIEKVTEENKRGWR